MDFMDYLKELERAKFYIFRVEDVSRLTGLGKRDAKKFISWGLDSDKIGSVDHGFYFLKGLEEKPVSFETIVHNYFKGVGYYLGLGYALRYWGFADFGVEDLIICRRKDLDNVAFNIGPYSFKFKYFDNKHFFGQIRVPVNGEFVHISDFEKTLLDTLIFLGDKTNFKIICDSIDLLKEKLDGRKFARYAARTENIEVIQRAGYILERLLENREAERLKEYKGTKSIPLDPEMDKRGEIDLNWNIIVNRSCEE